MSIEHFRFQLRLKKWQEAAERISALIVSTELTLQVERRYYMKALESRLNQFDPEKSPTSYEIERNKVQDAINSFLTRQKQTMADVYALIERDVYPASSHSAEKKK